MDRPADAAKFTGQTLAWFEQGEALAASEVATAAELRARRGRVRIALGIVVVCAILGFAAVLVARHYGLTFELPLGT